MWTRDRGPSTPTSMSVTTSVTTSVTVSEGDHWGGLRWRVFGVSTIAVLVLLDVLGGLAGGLPATANLSGTLALAPALTAVGGRRRHVLQVGALAVVVAALFSVHDEVPTLAGVTRCLVVVLATGFAAATAGSARAEHERQLDVGLEASRTLQAALVGHLPQPDHLRLASRYLPASSVDQVGGDWCDAVVDADGCLCLLVGDVVGHDLRAAAAMGSVRDVLRAFAVEGGQEPSGLLGRAEGVLQQLGVEVLATATVARVERQRSLVWCSAGHPPPVLLCADGTVRVLETDAGMMLGIGFGPERCDQRVELPDDSTLILYSDGLIENRSSDLATGIAKLVEAVGRHSASDPEALVDVLLRDLVDGSDHDDVVVLAIRAGEVPETPTGQSVGSR